MDVEQVSPQLATGNAQNVPLSGEDVMALLPSCPVD